MTEGGPTALPKKPVQETVREIGEVPENTTEKVTETDTAVEHTVSERIDDDPDIKAMHVDILERTNRDSQVQRALQDGKTTLGDSYQNIHERVGRREEMHAVNRFASAHPDKAQQYASRWDTLRTQYPQVESLPLVSFTGKDVFSWAKENKIDLSMNANELSLARDFSRSLETQRRQETEAKQLSEARTDAEKLSSHQSQLEQAEQQMSADEHDLGAVRQKLGLENMPVHTRNADIEKLRESIQEESTTETSIGIESTETGNRFFREAPNTMRELDVSDDEDKWTPNEREQLTEVRDFLDSAAETARSSKDEQMLREVEEYKEHFSYIGEKQFDEAIEGMARVVEQKVAQGKKVILFPFGKRSEKFVTEKLFGKLTASPFGKNVLIESNPYTLAKRIAENPDKSFVYIPDDFVISGARLEGASQMLTTMLVEHGLDEETAKSIITPLAIAGSDRQFKFGSKPFMYYRGNTFNHHPWPAVTGFHAATDYGFQNSLERFQEYMQGHGVKRSLPKLTKVKKPYEI